MDTTRAREKVYNPWHFRHTLAGNKTYCGRIVYERPVHLFGLGDLERIAAKITEKPAKSPISAWERIFRAVWDLCAGSAVPYFADWNTFKDVWEYLRWAILHTWEVVENPVGYLRTRTITLIQALADAFEISIEFK